MIKIPFSFYVIRFSDCDMFGHLNNARHIDYLNNARQDHLKDAYQMDLNEYYQQGMGWVTASNNIHYLKPAAFNETVCIQSALLRASEEYLLVEMLMMDMNKSHIKSLLWAKFVPVSIKTGKRVNHTPEFMQFVKSVECEDVPVSGGISERIAVLLSGIKKNIPLK